MHYKKIWLIAFLACLALPLVAWSAENTKTITVTAAQVSQRPQQVSQIPLPPSVDARFIIYDTAIRSNRRLLLETGTVEQANTVANIPATNPIHYIIGIGNVYTPGRSAGHIVNLMEVRNSTIIIQNK